MGNLKYYLYTMLLCVLMHYNTQLKTVLMVFKCSYRFNTIGLAYKKVKELTNNKN